jgi:hypothetical protein
MTDNDNTNLQKSITETVSAPDGGCSTEDPWQAGARGDEMALRVMDRLRSEGRWDDVKPLRDRMMKDAAGDKDARQRWVYSELDRLYPPLDTPEISQPVADDGQVQGLHPPAEWGQLPLNASLQAELSWVQSNRLSMVDVQPGGATVVHLERAREPAPSMAALGWLETSIRSYAKYVDVVARSLATAADETEHVHRERMRIDEMKALLAEMRDTSV